MGNRIGIFGGSFDPVHNGHIRIVKSFLSSGVIDDLMILLTPDPPHKDSNAQAGFDERFEMLKIAFDGMENVHISDLENKLPRPSYTYQTIEFLQQENPDTAWFLCIGEDSLSTFHTWYRYKDILARVTLLVAERPGFVNSETDPGILEKTIFVKHNPVDISSTKIRNEKGNDLSSSVPEAVAGYIREHQLYQN